MPVNESSGARIGSIICNQLMCSILPLDKKFKSPTESSTHKTPASQWVIFAMIGVGLHSPQTITHYLLILLLHAVWVRYDQDRQANRQHAVQIKMLILNKKKLSRSVSRTKHFYLAIWEGYTDSCFIHGRPDGSKRGWWQMPSGFINILLNVLIILVFNNKWLWNYQNDLKNL